jgi:hypothetical protein
MVTREIYFDFIASMSNMTQRFSWSGSTSTSASASTAHKKQGTNKPWWGPDKGVHITIAITA